MRRAIHSRQTCWAVAFALLLGMRLLTPNGFMPDWSGIRFQIAMCEDGGPRIDAVSHHSQHDKSDKSRHQPCPYAASAAESFLSPPALAVLPRPTLASVALVGASETALPLERKIQRPPSRAPPVLA